MDKPPKPMRKPIEDQINALGREMQALVPDAKIPFDYQFDHPIAGWSVAIYERSRDRRSAHDQNL